MKLRFANVSGGRKGYALINSEGPFGDEFVAHSFSKTRARILSFLLGVPIQ